jgi:hypothetical protein
MEINQIKNKQTHVHREIKSSPSNSSYQMKLNNIKINHFGCHNMANKSFFSLFYRYPLTFYLLSHTQEPKNK